jgi:hypothetical protein
MGWFSTVIERRTPRTWAILAILVGAIAMAAAVLLVGMQAAQASHSEVSLTGSNFEIEDSDPATLPGANLVRNDAPPSEDWGSVPQDTTAPISADGAEVRKADEPTGSSDDSFGQGTKEDTAVPTVVDGSIPPNKSDLLNFGVYLETNANGRFLNVFWHRVQEPSGTTNMDFEFNQSDELSANGVTPVRTAGDLLIQYDLAQGGTNPQLFVSRWITDDGTSTAADCEAANKLPCWGDKDNLSAAGDATGSINNVAITDAQNTAVDETDGLATGGTISPRTFGEAQIDFDALTGGTNNCVSFGSAYLKSRSSDSFTAALKDFIAPASLGLNNCATVIIRKETEPDGATATFDYTHNLNTDPALEDDASTPNIDESTQFELQDGGKFENNDVLQGTGYTVSEDLANIPASWELKDIDCSASTGVTPSSIDEASGTVTFAIDSNADVLDCTFTNQQLVSSISTAQSFFPNDTATISGTGLTFDGTVDFGLFGPDTTPNDATDNCTGTAKYTELNVALDATNKAASTTNGVPADSQTDYAIVDGNGNEGTYWWKVSYSGDSTGPDVTSCVENSTVSITNGGTVNSND